MYFETKFEIIYAIFKLISHIRTFQCDMQLQFVAWGWLMMFQYPKRVYGLSEL